MSLTESQKLIIEDCDRVKELLLEKNRKYGDSALNPVRIFSKSDAIEQIKVRIDDKLSRISSSREDEDEDVILDLIGYLHLLRITQKREKETQRSAKKLIDKVDKAFESNKPFYPQDAKTNHDKRVQQEDFDECREEFRRASESVVNSCNALINKTYSVLGDK